MTADKLYRHVKLWVDEVFGSPRDEKMLISHLREEVDELEDALDQYKKGFINIDEVLTEAADIQILLWNAMQNKGVCVNAFYDAVLIKHRVNTKRSWEMKDGKMKHKHPAENKVYYCVVCHKVPVDVANGYDTCENCANNI